MFTHQSVLFNEVLSALSPKPGDVMVDLTLGRAGHAKAMLEGIKPDGMLICFDQDKTALSQSDLVLSRVGGKFKLIHSNFSLLKPELTKLGIKTVNGILLDLGVSSPQIDDSTRGFSYQKDGPLDMRFNQDQALSADVVVNSYSASQLVKIFKLYGDVKEATLVANGIIKRRPIKTTMQLSNAIKDSLPAYVLRKKNPAKAIFQAIRVEVNDEYQSIIQVLKDAPALLAPGASLAVITFNSIEDRLVKLAFRPYLIDKSGKLPILVTKQYVAKSYLPSETEVASNNRARSAKLRVLTKLS